MFEHITYKESTLTNGLKLLTAQNNSVPVIDMTLWTRTGYRYEKPNELGYAHLLEHMLFGGTKKRPSKYDLALEVDRRGGYFNASTSQERVVYEMQMMSQDADQMCDILSDMVLNSSLSPERLNIERNVVLQELKQKQENHADFLSRFAQKCILPGHPMSHNILDTEEATKNATSESLRKYLQYHYRPDQAALVMSGDISHERAIVLAEKYFGGWKKPDYPFEPGLMSMPHAAKNNYHEFRDIRQTFIILSFYYSPADILREQAAWRMLSGYLSVGFTSALMQEVRERYGLVYNIRSERMMSKDVGIYSIITSTQKPRDTVDAIDRVVGRISEELTSDVFERVRGQAIGIFVRYIVKPENQSNEMGRNFIDYGRAVSPEEWLEHLQSVTRDEAISLAEKYLKYDNSVLVSLGPEDMSR